jgi:glyoxylase-like metal-dependent hydrolase (beta-lactamase superfamily II)
MLATRPNWSPISASSGRDPGRNPLEDFRKMTLAWTRSVLAAALLAAVVQLAAQTELPRPTPAMTTYETVKLAEGTYAFVSPESNGAMVTGNSLVVIGDDGVLVVDSGHFPSLTQRMITQIRQWTDQPVRFLVNTHWHPDHNAGNGLYQKAFPGVQIVSTPATRIGIDTEIPKKEVNEEIIAQISHLAQSGTTSTGKPLSAVERKYYEKIAPELEAFRPEMKLAEHALPTTTFDTGMTVYLGKREVRILFLGRGNTAGDAVVYVPDTKTLATGDLLVYPVPYPFGSFMGEWIGTLRKLQAMDAAVIVPGHGPVMRDKEFLNATVKLLESVQTQTDAACKQGLSLEETQKKVEVKELRHFFVQENAERGYFFDAGFLNTAVARAYREAKEGPLHDEN